MRNGGEEQIPMVQTYSGAATFSLSVDLLLEEELLPEGLALKSWTSNCHRSTCSPVSLLEMTMTSLEILPEIIHLFSWDMMRLM